MDKLYETTVLRHWTIGSTVIPTGRKTNQVSPVIALAIISGKSFDATVQEAGIQTEPR